ncbi:hypothetical protein DFQ01_114118 [Paenibacillus cellulosilyticus]|uniref:Uncharacterized protein n=1 Tax=Paenibacillus cellulosilyticus TaxID=375489 RepID=A0A2V2YTG3_9BACL|nr:hypothetical protein DFQ01_114118 [Paenibacillus cellulosilyticus]
MKAFIAPISYKRLFKKSAFEASQEAYRHRILNEATTSGSRVAHHYAPILIPCSHSTFSVLKTELFEHAI